MPTKFSRTLMLAAALGLTGGLAYAGEGVPGVEVNTDIRLSMSKLDANSDNKISKAEASADKTLSAEFATLDKDGNAMLDRGEFSKFEVEGDIGAPGDQPNRPYTKDDVTDDVK